MEVNFHFKPERLRASIGRNPACTVGGGGVLMRTAVAVA